VAGLLGAGPGLAAEVGLLPAVPVVPVPVVAVPVVLAFDPPGITVPELWPA
jgi:hypothetical protein